MVNVFKETKKMPHLVEKSMEEKFKKIKRFKRHSCKNDNEYSITPDLQNETAYLSNQQILKEMQMLDLLSARNDEITRLTDNKNEDSKQIKQLEKLIQEAKKQTSAVRTEKDQLEERYEAVLSQQKREIIGLNDSLHKIKRQKETEIEDLKNSVEEIKCEAKLQNKPLIDRVAFTELLLSQKESRIAILLGLNSNLETKVNVIDYLRCKAEENGHFANNKIEELKERESCMKKTMSKKNGEIALLKVLIQKLETDVKNMECLKDAAEEKMEKFKDRVEKMNERQRYTEREIIRLQSKIQNAKIKSLELDTELNREDRIFDIKDENERIKQDLSRIHEKRSQLEKELTLTCDKILSTREEYKRSQRYTNCYTDKTLWEESIENERTDPNQQTLSNYNESETNSISSCSQNQAVMSSSVCSLNSIRQISSEQQRIFHINATTVQIGDSASVSMSSNRSFDENSLMYDVEESANSQNLEIQN